MGRKKKEKAVPVFKPYNQNQQMLLPPSLDELIPEDHVVRVIDKVVEQLDLSPLFATYKGGGSSSYNPVMMLKVLLYGYIEQLYTPRRIAKALREHTHFMWLSGMNQPDFRTINNFRSGRLKKHIDQIFASLVLLLEKWGYIDLRNYFVDGTKMRANAYKYSYVWRKNTERYKRKSCEKIQELLAHIDELTEEENTHYGGKDLAELGADAAVDEEQLDKTVVEVNEQIEEATENTNNEDNEDIPPPTNTEIEQQIECAKERLEKLDDKSNRELKRDIKKLEKEYLPRLRKYEEQEKHLFGRNSYSKTDVDATFFRYKNDEILPSYNWLIGTENQFIIGTSVHQNAADSSCFVDHMNKLEELLGEKKIQRAIGDAGFGNEENYQYLEEHGIANFLKYSQFHHDVGITTRKKKKKKQHFTRDDFIYQEEHDRFMCPNGRKLLREEDDQVRVTATGFKKRIAVYRYESCAGCKYATICKTGKRNRAVNVSWPLEEYRHRARENLTSKEGEKLRAQRNVDVESVNGHIKFNRKFSRFLLRGLKKVNIETTLLSMAHDLLKMKEMNKRKICPC